MSAIFLRGQGLDSHAVDRRESRLSISSLNLTEEECENEEETLNSSFNDLESGIDKRNGGTKGTGRRVTIGNNAFDCSRKSKGTQPIGALLRRKSMLKNRKISRTRILLSKAETIYETYGLKHFTPILLLVLYSLIGATLFCMIEKPNEIAIDSQRRMERDRLRELAIKKLEAVLINAKLAPQTKLIKTRDLILDYEHQIRPEPAEQLHWDMWGALFYVGTIYTTIGYGNITCRTPGGRLLTMIYAMFGIPLVLAILNDLGSLFCRYICRLWKRVEITSEYAKRKARKAWQLTGRSKKSGGGGALVDEFEIQAQTQILMDAGAGGESTITGAKRDAEASSNGDDDIKQVPVTFALLLTFSWIFFCAALFLLWERDWSYFQAFYFFFVSLSTVGLGDVVPTKPRYMVMNFGLVIVGLSLVSMTLSVIQLNIEAFLYRMLKMIQEEYAAAMEAGVAVSKDHIVNRVMSRQPWYLKHVAPMIMTHSQKRHLGEIMDCATSRVRVSTGVQYERRDSCQTNSIKSFNTVPSHMQSLVESFHQTQSMTTNSDHDSDYDFDQFVPEFLKVDVQVQTDEGLEPLPSSSAHLPLVTVQYEDNDPEDLLRFDNWADATQSVEKHDAETQVTLIITPVTETGIGEHNAAGVSQLTFADDHNIIDGNRLVFRSFQETPVQTDDSYLKLAKKLETLKMNRAKSLAIWVSPISRRPKPLKRDNDNINSQIDGYQDDSTSNESASSRITPTRSL